MNNYIIILLIILTIGCNDLSEQVYSELTIEEYNYVEDEVYNIIGPVYENLRRLEEGGKSFIRLQDPTSDIIVMPANASGWDDGGLYKKLHQHTWTSDHVYVSGMWDILFRGVLHANRIIEQLEKGVIPISSEVKKNSLIAEMIVARAFYYWLLLDNFGDVPYVLSTSLVLPESTKRGIIYSEIVKDIRSSIDLLSSDNNSFMYGRFNKWSAKALLANIYLNGEVYSGESAWEECLLVCDDIIKSGLYRLEDNYSDCFNANNENSRETIFAIPNDEINGSLLYINHTLHASSKAKYDLKTTPWGAGCTKAIPQFIDTYDLDDSRLDDTWEHGLQFALDGITPLLCTYERAGEQLNYTKELPDGLFTPEDAGYRIIKFAPELGATNPMSNDVPFFRYSQVLMMKAECLLRLGKSEEAASIVSNVRQRAFKNNPKKAIVSGEYLNGNSKYIYGYVENYSIVDFGDKSAIEYGGLYDELGIEFAAEGMRRRDMIRFNTYTTKSWLSHIPNGSFRTVFPIPLSALESNSKLDQNFGY